MKNGLIFMSFLTFLIIHFYCFSKYHYMMNWKFVKNWSFTQIIWGALVKHTDHIKSPSSNRILYFNIFKNFYKYRPFQILLETHWITLNALNTSLLSCLFFSLSLKYFPTSMWSIFTYPLQVKQKCHPLLTALHEPDR